MIVGVNLNFLGSISYSVNIFKCWGTDTCSRVLVILIFKKMIVYYSVNIICNIENKDIVCACKTPMQKIRTSDQCRVFIMGWKCYILLYDVRQRIKTNKRPMWTTFLTWESVPCQQKKKKKKKKKKTYWRRERGGGGGGGRSGHYRKLSFH